MIDLCNNSNTDEQIKSPMVSENIPAWLNAPPNGHFPSPPIDTRKQTLPFMELTWENFERLIRRLVARESTISKCWIYGTPGQAQYGLDILAVTNHFPDKFDCYQCKRVKNFSNKDIEAAVDKFLSNKWAKKTKTFVLCTSLSLTKTEYIDEIIKQTKRLASENIDFNIWDGSDGGQLTEKLKNNPDLVDDFFLREWVHRFNGEDAANALGDKLQGIELEKLRFQLNNVYTILFLRHDPGLRLGSQRPASLLNRYIAPVVIESKNIMTSEIASVTPHYEQDQQMQINAIEQASHSPRTQSTTTQEIRIAASEWFSRHKRSVVLGEPGYGKSTLLRVISLQLLSASEHTVETPWPSLLPVWISFGGFSSAVQKAPNLSLEDYFDNWLHQNAADDIRPLFRRAVRQGEMLLLVDGLDEGQDTDAAKQAMDRISAFLAIRAIPAVFTSRPRGYERVRPDGVWPVVKLGAFDKAQIEQFTAMWFRYLESPDTINMITSEAAQQRTKEFLKAIQVNPRIIELARTPLFCQLLIDIFRYSHHLPEQRIKVYDKIIDMMLSDHPAARFQAAGLPSNMTAPRADDMYEMLMRLALHIQEIGGTGVISVAVCQKSFCDFLTDDLDGPGLKSYDAKHQAKIITDYAMSSLGLMVERSPTELGFFHLTIQEYLAAQSMVRKDEQFQLEWLSRVWDQPQWHEVVLAWFSIRGSNRGKSDTQRAIDCLKKSACSPWHKAKLLLLRTELATNDLGLSPREARATIDEAANEVEITPFQKYRRVLAGYIAQGLSSPSVADICENHIANWIPAQAHWIRSRLIKTLGQWKPANDLCNALFIALHDEVFQCRWAAAETLAEIFSDDEVIGNQLALIAKSWPNLGVRTVALHSLWKGWASHFELEKLAFSASKSKAVDLALVGISIRVSKNIHNQYDRQTLWSMLINRTISYELQETCCSVLVQGWGKDQELKQIALEKMNERQHNSLYEQELILTFLVSSWPGDIKVAPYIINLIHQSFSFLRYNSFLSDAIYQGFGQNQEIIELIKKNLDKQKKKAFLWTPAIQNIYLITGGDSVKSMLLDEYLQTESGSNKFWICDTLMKGWCNDVDVIAFMSDEYKKPPREVAMLVNWVHLFIKDTKLRRNWLLEIINTGEDRYINSAIDLLLEEFSDEESINTAKLILTKDISFYYKISIQNKLIEICPNDSDVQLWVGTAFKYIDEISLSSIASSYENDPEIRGKILKIVRPASSDVRTEVFRIICDHPIPPEPIQRLTSTIFIEETPQVRTAGLIARCIASQQLPNILPQLRIDIKNDLNALGIHFEMRRRSAFAALLYLEEYDICAEIFYKEKPELPHWIISYDESDALFYKILFENLEKIQSNKLFDENIKIDWRAVIYNGFVRAAIINSYSRGKLIEYLKAIPYDSHDSLSLSLMAELLPTSKELHTCLIKIISDKRLSIFDEAQAVAESQCIYAEQFAGDNKALVNLKEIYLSFEKNKGFNKDSLLNVLYALAIGWPESELIQSFLKLKDRPEIPIYIALLICGHSGNENKGLEYIDRLIDHTLKYNQPLTSSEEKGLRQWSSFLSTDILLQNLLKSQDYSLRITALRLLHQSGKLKDENRFDMIKYFNEQMSGVDSIAEGINIYTGQVISVTQAIADEFLIASGG